MKIRDEFAVHMLNERGIAKAEQLAAIFTTSLTELEEAVGNSASREMSLVRTKMQEASFWAKRAMAVDPKNQKA